VVYHLDDLREARVKEEGDLLEVVVRMKKVFNHRIGHEVGWHDLMVDAVRSDQLFGEWNVSFEAVANCVLIRSV
jgi:hypothetical protein